MQINEKQAGNVAVVQLRGDLEARDLTALARRLDEIVASGTNLLCVNLRRVSFLNSTVLGHFVATAKRLQAAGGALALCEAPDSIDRNLHTLNLDALMPRFTSESAALARLASGDGSG